MAIAIPNLQELRHRAIALIISDKGKRYRLMNNHPDFDQYGYQVIQELGRNREAGRITYLAKALNLKQKVVIKEFRFAIADSSWSGYKAYQREIEVLQQLDHPRIPRYLGYQPDGCQPSICQPRRCQPRRCQSGGC